MIRSALSGVLAVAGLGLAVWVSGLAPAAADPVGPVDPGIPLPAGPAPVVPAPVVPAPAGPALVVPAPVVPAPGVPAPAGPALVVPAPGVPAPAGNVPLPASPAPKGMLGQVAQAVQSNPVAALNELLARSPQPAVPPGQPPAMLPGTPPAPPAPLNGPPVADPLTAARLLMPKNYRMPTPDQVSPYALAPNDNPSPFARIDAWKGVHAVVHSNLGRMPGNELGQPLPGTAPPPGTALPPGLEQFYLDPLLAPPAPSDGAPPAVNGASG